MLQHGRITYVDKYLRTYCDLYQTFVGRYSIFLLIKVEKAQ